MSGYADTCAYYAKHKKQANRETIAALERALRPKTDDTDEKTAKKIERFLSN